MDRTDVKSSNIKSIGYDPNRKKLEVEFLSGDVYRYQNVPKNVFSEFLNSRSKGKFLNSDIKYQYAYRKYQDKNGDMTHQKWHVMSPCVNKTACQIIDELLLEKLGRLQEFL